MLFLNKTHISRNFIEQIFKKLIFQFFFSEKKNTLIIQWAIIQVNASQFQGIHHKITNHLNP